MLYDPQARVQSSLVQPRFDLERSTIATKIAGASSGDDSCVLPLPAVLRRARLLYLYGVLI